MICKYFFVSVLLTAIPKFGISQCEIKLDYRGIDSILIPQTEKYLDGMCVKYKAERKGKLKIYNNGILENEYLIKTISRNETYIEIEVSNDSKIIFRFFLLEKKIETLMFENGMIITETGSGVDYKISKRTHSYVMKNEI